MNKTKVIVSLIILILGICLIFNSVQAVDDKYLNIRAERPFSDDNADGEVGNDRYIFIRKTDANSSVDETIWKIYDVNKTTYDNIYCLRGGLGFGSHQATQNSLLYSFVADMKQNANTVIQTYHERTGITLSNDNYNSILWIVDNIYLPNDDETYVAEDYKAELLEKAEIVNSELTTDDIEVIQQMALWYFTNRDENGQYGSFSLSNTIAISNILKINSDNFSDISKNRADQAIVLYEYFINGATTNRDNYGTDNVRQIENTQMQITSTTRPQINEINDYVLVGPFNFEKQGNSDYDIENEKVQIKLDNGTIHEIPFGTTNSQFQYAISDANGNLITSRNDIDSVASMIGEGQFYIRLVKSYLNLWLGKNTLKSLDVSFAVNWQYYDTTSEFWAEAVHNQGNPAQPVGITTRKKVNDTYNVNVTTEQLNGMFNLNLIKTDELGNVIINEAKFELELQDVTNVRPSQYTTTNGGILIEDIDIIEENQVFIYKVTETNEPEGYIGLDKPFYVRINTGIDNTNSNYIVKKVELVEYDARTNTWNVATDENIAISLVGNTVKVEVRNKEIEPFDLSLRKFITEVNGKELTESREPKIDFTNFNKIDSTTNKKITTATYEHPKNVINVRQGDIVKYKIRVYNEGERDGYVNEITDYLPKGLGLLVQDSTNNIWKIPTDGSVKPLVGTNGLYKEADDITNNYLKNYEFKDALGTEIELNKVYVLEGNSKITTDILKRDEAVQSANLIKAYDSNVSQEDIAEEELWQEAEKGESGLYYREVEVVCIVLAENTYKDEIRNIAEITKAADKDGVEIKNEGDDRDSVPNNVDITNYNPPTDNSSYQEDDDDYEAVGLKCFDLALRKFITGVNEEKVSDREPQVVYQPNTNQINYVHTKEPVKVKTNDIVYYTLRIYNEGSIAGYADEIADDIPEGLEYLPENETNIKYGWNMYYEEENILVKTDDSSKATTIRTSYLKYDEEGKNLLEAFNSKTMSAPDYKEVQIAFKVIEPTTSDRIIINSAQISDDSDEYGKEIKDEDSIPDKWNEGEDDQDQEFIYVEYFDLALLKWVSKSIVTVEGKTTTTETGYDGLENPEPIVKVEVKKLNKTTVKFEYGIKITNEGEIAGYATEIKDHIPEGLKFLVEDNKSYGWVEDENGTVSTRALETTLLQPGESKIIYITFTWINGENNLGVKTNFAEISEDYNESDSPDIDSVPDNLDVSKGIEEDDEDLALVMLAVQTGSENAKGYIILISVALIMLLGGITLIKKYVLI